MSLRAVQALMDAVERAINDPSASLGTDPTYMACTAVAEQIRHVQVAAQQERAAPSGLQAADPLPLSLCSSRQGA